MHNRLGLTYPTSRKAVIEALMKYGVSRLRAETALTDHVGYADIGITWAEAEHVADVLGI